VLSDIPTFRELWCDAALYVTKGDANGLAAAVSCLAADPQLRRTVGRAAQAQARAMAGLYGRVLARRPLAESR
jgi:glycosyltransferase involved in cell wall biosynthesis